MCQKKKFWVEQSMMAYKLVARVGPKEQSVSESVERGRARTRVDDENIRGQYAPVKSHRRAEEC